MLTSWLLAAPAFALGAESAQGSSGAIIFRALLDGKPIGEHRFSFVAGDTDAADRTLISEANYTVQWFGITVYRYRHRAVERWRRDCLVALSAETDDNGKRSSVVGEHLGDAFVITMPAPQSAPGCVMSYAYWNPALRSQNRLVNAQSGRIEAVNITPIGNGVVEVDRQPVSARAYRISGPAGPIDVWYSAQGDWIGLDTIVEGGRKLSYRRQ